MTAVHEDQLHDKTYYLNVMPTEKYYFSYLKVGRLHSSSWQNYYYMEEDAKYKFFGIQVNISDRVNIHRRVTHDLL